MQLFHQQILQLMKAIRKSSKNHSEKIPEMVPKSSKKHVCQPWKMQAENKFIIKKVKWKPQISLEQGLKHSIEWYKKFIKNNFYEN